MQLSTTALQKGKSGLSRGDTEFGFGQAEESRQLSPMDAMQDVQSWLAEGGKMSSPGHSPPQMDQLGPNQYINPLP